MGTRKIIGKAVRVLALSCLAASAFARTDLADAPLTTSSSSSVLPNLMFIMDDSGSMAWEHLPDDATDAGSSVTFRFGYYGLRSSQCNEIYYHPGITYSPPVYADGTSYPDADFRAALPDGFRSAGSQTAVDLSTSFRASVDSSSVAGDNSGSAAYYYNYTGSQASLIQRDYNSTTNTFYRECSSAVNTSPGRDVFTLVTVSGAAQQRNFANWYSYYRTRLLMMKTAAGQAFKAVDAKYRVGFMTINNNNGSGNDFLNISNFDQTQKNNWYGKLYASAAGNSTPLRQALSTAGRVYAGQVASLYGNTVTDPLQYSCQQNFTILSTDGFWNGLGGTQLDGTTAIGNQDSGQDRPYTDGGTATFNVTTTQIQQSQTQALETVNQIERRTTQIKMRTQQIQTRTVQNQTRTVTTTNAKANLVIQQANSGSSITRIRINGTDRLTVDVSGTGLTSAARMDSLVAGIAANLSDGYQATAYGTCTGSNAPVSGCGSAGDRYITIMAPTGSGTTPNGYGFNISDNNVTFRFKGSFAGGSGASSTSSWTNIGSCSVSVSYSGNTRTEVQCRVASDTVANTSSCAPSNPLAGPTVSCPPPSDSGWVNASSCTASGPTNGQTITCDTIDSGWQAVQNCAPSTSNGQEITCRTNSTGPTVVASCTPQAAAAGNSWTQRVCSTNTISPAAGVESCNPVPASALNGYVSTNCTTVQSSPVQVANCTSADASAANNWTTTSCGVASTTGGVANTLADVAQYYYATDLRTANCTGTPVPPAATGNDVCHNNVPASGLDTASWQHMTTFTLGLGARGRMNFSPTYLTDISGDYFSVKNGSVATSTATPPVCTWQTAGSVCNWPVPGINASGNDGKIENIDDLWHAAVNGRGTYFSATNPTTLATGLNSALSGVTVRTGGTAAATTSSPNIVAGDNFVFSSNFTSGEWSGELFRFTLDPVTLAFSANNDWQARTLLDAKPYTNRTIYTFDTTNATTRLKQFDWDNLTTDERNFFSTSYIGSGTDALTQLCTTGANCLPSWQASHSYAVGDEYRNGNNWYRVSTAYTSGAAFGSTDTGNATAIDGASNANLVNFLRGERTNEGALADAKYFRQRAHVLGDIVSSEAVYVKSPHYQYRDAGYAEYMAAQASRAGMVYIAANDGMLHALKAGGATITNGDQSGQEAWAYIPSIVLPNLYKLADKSYSTRHRFFVDGTPTQGDVYFGGAWHTILVGGLNGGGRGYYALDVTDPADPKALWEFTYDTSQNQSGYVSDANLGFSYGRPVITKLKNGTWVVLVTSGYNNGDGTAPGDGRGYLYVLDAGTGAKIGTPIGTGVGDTANPSGLAQIAQWADHPALDNTARRVYGGDLMGNLWRFDIDDNLGTSGNEAQLLATLRGPTSVSNPTGTAQPITSKPVLGDANGYPMVFVGTGKLLGQSDLGDTAVQSFYGIKDHLGSTSYGSPRGDNAFVRQILTVGTCPVGAPSSACSIGQRIRTGTSNPVDLSVKKGWFLDFPDPGERANTDSALALGTLAINTNIPESNACTSGGYSFAYFLNYLTGAPLINNVPNLAQGIGARSLGNGLTSRPVVIESTTGKVVTINQVDGVGAFTPISVGGPAVFRPTEVDTPIVPGVAGTKRISWRELSD
jgi:type IV pilus assembly protein PilY1